MKNKANDVIPKMSVSRGIVISVLRETAKSLFSPVLMLMFFTGGMAFCFMAFLLHKDFVFLLSAISSGLGAFAAADTLFEMQNYYRDHHNSDRT